MATMDTTSSSWFTPSGARAYRAIRRSKDCGDFPLFSFLPTEVQVLILKYALPPPRVIRFAFDTKFNGLDIILNLQILPDLHLTPLLNTSWFFNTEILRQYKKVEIQKYKKGSRSQLFTAMRLQGLALPNFFWQHSRRNNFGVKGSGYRSLSHVYLQPEHDTLLMSYRQLFLVYLVGGSIDLSCVRHLALINSGDLSWRHRLFNLSEIDISHLMYGMLSMQCPALEKLSVIIGNESAVTDMDIDVEEIIFDVTDEFFYFEFEDENGRPSNREPTPVVEIAEDILLDFQNLPNHQDPNYELRPESVRFWSERVPVPGLIGRIDQDKSWREKGKKCPEPRLYLPGFGGYLPVHADGTVLDAYKGLAQIFDGAPW
ncbi:hypothetical protein OCU04_006586 [Sclerotinia nivalis]|uniref:2EXR domain-containing protein n=1 Tax=Sclerotinia nivalis TaxID=352851 RepID=A0A9X0AL04_9HELO|nr:hypothetical protein OCU04_006586 [Sclerotinia nivalis]